MKSRGIAGLAALVMVGAVWGADATMPASTPPPLPTPVAGYPIGWCIRGKAEVVAQAKGIGYEYVELAMQDVLPLSEEDFGKLKSAVEASGMKVRGGYNVVPKTIMLVGPAVDVAKQEEQIKKVVERAGALKMEFVVLNAGGSWKVPEGYEKGKAFSELTDFCKRFSAAAGKAGIDVLVEPVRTSDSNQLITIAETVKLVEAVGDEHFGMLVDYSFVAMEKDDYAQMKKAGGKLKQVWVSNPANNRKYAFDDSESDYAKFFGVLKEMRYRGGISVHGGPVTTVEADGPRAIGFLRGHAKELAEK